MSVALGRLDLVVAERNLDDRQVGSRVDHPRGVGVTQVMHLQVLQARQFHELLPVEPMALDVARLRSGVREDPFRIGTDILPPPLEDGADDLVQIDQERLAVLGLGDKPVHAVHADVLPPHGQDVPLANAGVEAQQHIVPEVLIRVLLERGHEDRHLLAGHVPLPLLLAILCDVEGRIPAREQIPGVGFVVHGLQEREGAVGHEDPAIGAELLVKGIHFAPGDGGDLAVLPV